MFGIKKNVQLGPPLKLSSWRKVALGTWKTVGDPSVYGVLELDAAPALAYIEKLRRETGLHVTMSHFCGRAMAEVLKRHPSINCILRYGRLYPRLDIDIFFQVASDDTGEDLTGMTVRRADTKSVPEIAREMVERVRAIKEKRDQSYEGSKKTVSLMPGMLTGPLLTVLGFLLYTLNLWHKAVGSPRDPFGSCMITNIGSIGLDMAFAPLVPYSRIPILIAMGAVRDVPVVKDGQVVPGKTIRLNATFDHRLIDGVHASHMSRTMQKIFADPEKELGGAR